MRQLRKEDSGWRAGKVGAGLTLVEQELRQIEKEQNGAGD